MQQVESSYFCNFKNEKEIRRRFKMDHNTVKTQKISTRQETYLI